jgi:hypothetical protein
MGESLGWGCEKNHGEQGNAKSSADNNNEFNTMMLMLPLRLPQMERSMSAITIGQNKVTINLYCRRWQPLKEEKWQKGRRHDDGQQTKAIHTTIKQRSQDGRGVGSGDDNEENDDGVGSGSGINNDGSG